MCVRMRYRPEALTNWSSEDDNGLRSSMRQKHVDYSMDCGVTDMSNNVLRPCQAGGWQCCTADSYINRGPCEVDDFRYRSSHRNRITKSWTERRSCCALNYPQIEEGTTLRASLNGKQLPQVSMLCASPLRPIMCEYCRIRSQSNSIYYLRIITSRLVVNDVAAQWQNPVMSNSNALWILRNAQPIPDSLTCARIHRSEFQRSGIQQSWGFEYRLLWRGEHYSGDLDEVSEYSTELKHSQSTHIVEFLSLWADILR